MGKTRWRRHALAAGLAVLAAGAQPGCSESAAPDATNLVLITIDTVRADRIGAYGHESAQTPVLDGIAARGVRFDDAIAQATTTPPSHASILTGLYPARHGLRRLHGQRLPDANHTLAELLRDRGYTTAAFVSALPLRREMGLDQGFDVYDDDLADGLPKQVAATAQTEARQTNERVFRWLDGGPRPPLFLWVHYFDAHHPYTPPAEFSRRFGEPPARGRRQPPALNVNEPFQGRMLRPPPGPVVDRMSRLYDAELAYLDTAIGELLDRLEADGLLERAVIAVVADHGEHFGEGGYYFGHWDVLDQTARVPMLLAHSDGRDAGRVIEGSVGTIDLMPTLLSWLGVDTDLQMDGRDLSPALAGSPLDERPIYTEQFEYFPVRAVRAGPWMLRQVAAPRQPVAEGVERFGPRSDPEAALDDDAARDSLRHAFEQALADAAEEGATPGEAIDVSDEVRAQLEALGYTDEAGGPDGS